MWPKSIAMQDLCKEQKHIFKDNLDSIKGTEVLLVTANVGSLFEDPKRLLKPWVNEFLSKISQLEPEFIALHLQEVGGKTYEKSMEHVQEFIKNLCDADKLHEYSCIQIYMDEDYKSAEHFTALGNLYFAHQSLNTIKIWNFLSKTWEVVHGKNIYSGNIEATATKEKSKFPQHFFPECKWSRKGFMRTRWNLNGTVLDLVNIHLFHDASNLAACEEFPSVYCKTRRRALVHTLERFHLDKENGFVPFFVFGDFNFRCDAGGVVKELTENLTAHRVHNIKHDSTKVHYRNSEGNNILTVGNKEFIHADHQVKFKESWLKKYDRELEPLREILFEYPIQFPPTYPYEEDPEMPTAYMSTRCPAWCDRILMSFTAKEIIENETKCKDPYNIIGDSVCMGDHKPIYLHIKLKPNQGTYRCCKCHLNFAKTNKSASQAILASIEISEMYDTDYHCPYGIQIYNDILIECTKQNIYQTDPNRNLNCIKKCALNIHSSPIKNCHDLPQHSHSSQFGNSVLKQLNHPPVSINIFDSDNIHVCMCAQKSYTDIDGSFCQECHNTIKKQPLGQTCSLISRQVMLSNDIIVNRVDTQYLNTHLDWAQERIEPYTPESAESHSPYPEPHSTSTSSSNSRSFFQRHSKNLQQTKQGDISSPQVQAHSNVCPLQKTICLKDDLNESVEMQRRGIVSPGQLKSRLEDLQRSSLHNLNDANCNNDDVDNVDKICRKFEKQKCCCLPGCCII